jgi:hypothetical protein
MIRAFNHVLKIMKKTKNKVILKIIKIKMILNRSKKFQNKIIVKILTDI